MNAMSYFAEPAVTLEAIPPIPEFWYILRVHPGYTLKAEKQLVESFVQAYVPKEPRIIKTAWARRVARLVPIFPGTVFVPNFNPGLDRLKDIAEGVGGYIRRGSEPLRVSLFWMDQIRKFEAKLNRDPVKRKYRINQTVRITEGPFELLEGRIERLDNKYRISVLVTLLGREVPLELDEDHVQPV